MRNSALLAVALTVAAAAAPAAAAGAPDGSQLVQAARSQNVEAVRALIKGGVDVNAAQDDGATALHWAAHWNDLQAAELLLEHGARVNQANEYGATPLWLASVNGSAPMVNLLLKKGADPNMALHFGETPLMTASRGGALEVVRALLASNAKVDAKEAQWGQTALMWATAEGHLDVMKALLDAGADVNATSKTRVTALMFTARHGSVEAARLLLDRGADINPQSLVVNDSALGGGISKTQQGGATTLLRAVVRGHVPLALFLLDRGADPNLSGTGYAPLHWAAGKWEASINKEYTFEDGEWASLYGIRSKEDKERLIRALVAKGANVNAVAKTEPTRPGATLLVLIDAQVRLGVTPFYIAAMSADAETMRLLLSLGADASIPSANKTTPLMVAAGRIRIDYETTVREEDALAATKVAVEAGNDVNAVNNAGETVLHAAAIGGWTSVVEYLLSKGATASLKAVDKKGKTPFMQADEGNGHSTSLTQKRPEAAALLAKYGEKAQ